MYIHEPIKVDAVDAFEGMTISVKITSLSIWRIKLGFFLMSLAARVLRCNFTHTEITTSTD